MITKTCIESCRFGNLEVDNDQIITFPTGLVGFSELRGFVAIDHGSDSPFVWLQAIEDPAVAFLVVDPAVFIADYAPLMSEACADALQMSESTQRVVYTIVNIPPGQPEEMTLNLAGPIVVNVEKRLAAQLVLEDEIYELKHKVQLNERSSAA